PPTYPLSLHDALPIYIGTQPCRLLLCLSSLLCLRAVSRAGEVLDRCDGSGVDAIVRAVDEAGGVRAQEGDDLGHFLRPAAATEFHERTLLVEERGDRLVEARALLLGTLGHHLVGHLRGDERGRDGVDQQTFGGVGA